MGLSRSSVLATGMIVSGRTTRIDPAVMPLAMVSNIRLIGYFLGVRTPRFVFINVLLYITKKDLTLSDQKYVFDGHFRYCFAKGDMLPCDLFGHSLT